ncbi:hypothetical protein VNO78_27083 [Psophocarpus tetragonolobus]|uniref:Uncharacterized protein n=1 Tax=Psophocarpus tetragonolobus TaxID=3891 RepID=A0AAN9S1V2_PSOTE
MDAVEMGGDQLATLRSAEFEVADLLEPKLVCVYDHGDSTLPSVVECGMAHIEDPLEVDEWQVEPSHEVGSREAFLEVGDQCDVSHTAVAEAANFMDLNKDLWHHEKVPARFGVLNEVVVASEDLVEVEVGYAEEGQNLREKVRRLRGREERASRRVKES